MTPTPPPQVLEGVLERVTFSSEEGAWSVVKLAVPGHRELVTAVGNLPGVQPGENLRLRGAWVRDKQFGEQFKVEGFQTVVPATLAGLEKYLGSGMVRGLGRAMAARIVAHFGIDTLKIIDADPARLVEVEGIGPVRSGRIRAAWTEQRSIREVMVFLQSQGISTLLAVRIFKQYGERAISIVRENPYRLAEEVFGIGFKTADTIAANLGIAPTSPRRAQAGALHTLSELADEGHVCFPREELEARAAKLLGVEPTIVAEALTELATRNQVVIEATAGGGEAVFLTALQACEAGVAAQLQALCARPAPPLTLDLDKAIAWFESRSGLTLAPEQREALAQVVRSKVLVITGGPGTGKTTLVNAILQILERKKLEILLAAPTGRAAKRMTETTGHPASTLHRLLEYDPRTRGFKRTRQNPLEADLVILDEASMIDTVLAYDTLSALPPAARLVLVGDVDQLPSVGPGRVLADLIDSGAVPVVRLQHIFRQAQESLIVVNAHRLNRGEPIRAAPPGAEADFFFIERREPAEVLATIKNLVAERIPRRFGFDPMSEIQVLTPMNRGPLGAVSLNAELQALLNPQGAEVARGARILRLGDRVMQLRNNYDQEVFNGDLGRIRRIDAVEHEVDVEFDGRLVTYDPALLDELSLAYATTIHKSQGSEYPAVVMPVHTTHFMMLARNLLYTGLTRGRKLVVWVGNARALEIAAKRGATDARHTRLRERLMTARDA